MPNVPTIPRAIALLKSNGYAVRRTRVRVNNQTAYRLRFPGEPYERFAWYTGSDLLLLAFAPDAEAS